jgi:signal transduction histidine kinase
MDKTLLEIPTELLQAAHLTPEDAKTELAIRLFQLHKLNEEQAAELAGDADDFRARVWNHQQTGQLNLDDFISWASHDLKTPLNAVIGFTKVVLKGIDGPLNETQTADLTTAFNGGQRMLALISQLVEIARLNNGHLTLSRSDRDLADLLVETAERWKNQNPSKPLSTDIQIASPVFSIDPQQMRQVITYLLTLAALRVTEGAVLLSARGDELGLKLSIQSEGKKAADPMEMDVTMLGFIARALIKMHGGQMADPQETGTGLVLGFTLPR